MSNSCISRRMPWKGIYTVADTRILLAGLEEYHRVLGRHVSQLSSEFQGLSSVWQRFAAVYEGDAADQFKHGWIRTTAMFQEYLEQTHQISGMLDERIDALRQANRTEGGLVG